jgi:hypothetical protein
MWILGEDAHKILADQCSDAVGPTVTISRQTLLVLLDYWEKLRGNCKHEFDYGSPIDTGICFKCGAWEKGGG